MGPKPLAQEAPMSSSVPDFSLEACNPLDLS